MWLASPIPCPNPTAGGGQEIVSKKGDGQAAPLGEPLRTSLCSLGLGADGASAPCQPTPRARPVGPWSDLRPPPAPGAPGGGPIHLSRGPSTTTCRRLRACGSPSQPSPALGHYLEGPTRSRAGAARAPGRDGSADRGEMRTPPHPVEAGLRPDGVSTAAAVSPLGEVGRPRLPRSWHGHGPGVPSKFALERAGGLMW